MGVLSRLLAPALTSSLAGTLPQISEISLVNFTQISIISIKFKLNYTDMEEMIWKLYSVMKRPCSRYRPTSIWNYSNPISIEIVNPDKIK